MAGNPNDPAKLAGAAAAWSGMTELERRLRETVAKQVMKHTHGIDQEQWDETLTVSIIYSIIFFPFSSHSYFSHPPILLTLTTNPSSSGTRPCSSVTG